MIAVPDEGRGEAPKAFVVLRSGEEASAGEIVGWAKERMAAYKYPREVEFVDELPKSGSGKILWRQLQEKEAQKTARAK